MSKKVSSVPGFSFNKAIAAFTASAIPAFGAFTTSCAGVFGIFGTSSTSAQVIAAGLVGVIAGAVTWLVPNA